MRAAHQLLSEITVSDTYSRTCHDPNGAGRGGKYFATMLMIPEKGLFGEARERCIPTGGMGLEGGSGLAAVCGEA